MAGPLETIRVIDSTHALNGPFCTMLLGHLGTEIIKLNRPRAIAIAELGCHGTRRPTRMSFCRST
jgi:crotonobetainyl-CoA:carnitine CoA-transferase CaiB-like acyl-CoA transferase